MHQHNRQINGDAVLALLASHGLSQAELARRAGIHRMTVNHVVKGRKSASPDMQRRIADVFGCTVAAITIPAQREDAA